MPLIEASTTHESNHNAGAMMVAFGEKSSCEPENRANVRRNRELKQNERRNNNHELAAKASRSEKTDVRVFPSSLQQHLLSLR
jgi:hypothetical protein